MSEFYIMTILECREKVYFVKLQEDILDQDLYFIL